MARTCAKILRSTGAADQKAVHVQKWVSDNQHDILAVRALCSPMHCTITITRVNMVMFPCSHSHCVIFFVSCQCQGWHFCSFTFDFVWQHSPKHKVCVSGTQSQQQKYSPCCYKKKHGFVLYRSMKLMPEKTPLWLQRRHGELQSRTASEDRKETVCWHCMKQTLQEKGTRLSFSALHCNRKWIL